MYCCWSHSIAQIYFFRRPLREYKIACIFQSSKYHFLRISLMMNHRLGTKWLSNSFSLPKNKNTCINRIPLCSISYWLIIIERSSLNYLLETGGRIVFAFEFHALVSFLEKTTMHCCLPQSHRYSCHYLGHLPIYFVMSWMSFCMWNQCVHILSRIWRFAAASKRNFTCISFFAAHAWCFSRCCRAL